MKAEKEKQVDVSITTINWNVEDKLKNCISSFLNTYETLNYEWFITDNNSRGTDFESLISKYSDNPQITFIKNEKNEGLAVLNKLLDRVKGRYWVFLDPDTVQKGNPIDNLISFMDSRSDVGIASAKQLKPDGSSLLYYGTRLNIAYFFFIHTPIGRLLDHYLFSDKKLSYHSFSNLDLTKFNQIDQVPFACTIARTELLREDGYVIDPDLSFYYNDVDLCKRVWDKGYKVYLIPTAEIIHDHASSYKKIESRWKVVLNQKCMIKYFKKHHKYKSWIIKALLITYTLISMFDIRKTNKWTTKEKITLMKSFLLW